jgi:hypothetical protein
MFDVAQLMSDDLCHAQEVNGAAAAATAII